MIARVPAGVHHVADGERSGALRSRGRLPGARRSGPLGARPILLPSRLAGYGQVIVRSGCGPRAKSAHCGGLRRSEPNGTGAQPMASFMRIIRVQPPEGMADRIGQDGPRFGRSGCASYPALSMPTSEWTGRAVPARACRSLASARTTRRFSGCPPSSGRASARRPRPRHPSSRFTRSSPRPERSGDHACPDVRQASSAGHTRG